MQIRDSVRLMTILAVLAGLILTAGCGQKSDTGKASQGGPPEVAVVTVQPERVVITTELSGRTSAYLVAEVRPQVGGIIQKRLFTEGGDVKAGAVLYQIDPATYSAAYASAKATLARAEANETSIRYRAERYKELVPSKAVSQQEYDDAAAALKQAEAEIQAGKAAVQTARINLDHTRVTAPISGRTGRSLITVGALATAGQGTALTTIQQIDPIYVDVTQSSASLLRLQRSMASGTLKKDGANSAKVKLLLEDGTPYPHSAIPGCHSRSDDRVLYSADCIPQSKRHSAAGHVRSDCPPGGNQRTGAPGSAAERQPGPQGKSRGSYCRRPGKGPAADPEDGTDDR